MNENIYNGYVHTFIAEPLINADWSALANDPTGAVPGVTLGVDSWYPVVLPALTLRKPFFNRLGGGTTADMTVYFDKNDQVYINDLTIFCNFADGLLKDGNVTVTPVPFSLPENGAPNYELSNELKVQIVGYRLDVNDDIHSMGSIDLPVSHFNRTNQLGLFLPYTASSIVQTDKAIWYEIGLIDDSPVSQISYSTININPAFQSTRVLVWAEATLSHTFPTVDFDSL